MDALVRWFGDVGHGDVAEVGGKGANLGELSRAGLPVPDGFVVTSSAYRAAMDAGGVRDSLRQEFDDTQRRCSDPEVLARGAARLRELVHKAGVPDDVRGDVVAAYRRLDYATLGIRVNAVCPGVIDTEMVDRFTGDQPEARDALTAMEPMARMGRSDEIADAVVWLCSDRASFVTGQAIAIDGGFVAR
jgi:hypothetical protein